MVSGTEQGSRTIAIMQPYLFPYLNYWRLMQAADVFVMLDDVAYRKKGFINRNQILLDDRAHRFTLPLHKASQNRLINQHRVATDASRLLRTLEHAYRRAPQFETIFPLIASILQSGHTQLADLLEHSLQRLAQVLQINTRLIRASDLAQATNLRGQDRLISLTRWLSGSHYLNAAGGRALYDADAFAAQGLQLAFIAGDPVRYRQFGAGFVPDLSIIDVLMFNPLERVRGWLDDYRVECAPSPSRQVA